MNFFHFEAHTKSRRKGWCCNRSSEVPQKYLKNELQDFMGGPFFYVNTTNNLKRTETTYARLSQDPFSKTFYCEMSKAFPGTLCKQMRSYQSCCLSKNARDDPISSAVQRARTWVLPIPISQIKSAHTGARAHHHTKRR